MDNFVNKLRVIFRKFSEAVKYTKSNPSIFPVINQLKWRKRGLVFISPKKLSSRYLHGCRWYHFSDFRLVCKSWRSMISNPELVENHLANSHKREAYVLRFPTVPVNEAGWIGNFNNAFYFDIHDFSFTLHLSPQL